MLKMLICFYGKWNLEPSQVEPIQGVPSVDLKTNSLPDISAAKILFWGAGGIRRELKFRACNHDKPPSGKGRETPLQRGERIEVAVEKKRIRGFSLVEFLPREKRSLSSS